MHKILSICNSVFSYKDAYIGTAAGVKYKSVTSLKCFDYKVIRIVIPFLLFHTLFDIIIYDKKGIHQIFLNNSK